MYQCEKNYPYECQKPAQFLVAVAEFFGEEFGNADFESRRCKAHTDELVEQFKKSGITPEVEPLNG